MRALIARLAGAGAPVWLFHLVPMLLLVWAGYTVYHMGEQAGATKYLKRANADLAAANTFINELQREARDAELAHAKRLAGLDKRYQEKQAYEKTQNDIVVRNLRAGISKLQYRTSSHNQTDSDTASAVKPSASGGDGAETSELPPTLAGDIYDLAARADEITEQLGACQQVIVEDREVCGIGHE